MTSRRNIIVPFDHIWSIGGFPRKIRSAERRVPTLGTNQISRQNHSYRGHVSGKNYSYATKATSCYLRRRSRSPSPSIKTEKKPSPSPPRRIEDSANKALKTTEETTDSSEEANFCFCRRYSETTSPTHKTSLHSGYCIGIRLLHEMKRGRGDVLTGGTKDVSPQYLSFNVAESAADTTTTITQAIPRQFLQQGQKLVQIMEVLKCYFFFDESSAPNSQGEYIRIFLSTSSFGTTATNFSEPRVFAGHEEIFTVVTSGATLSTRPFIYDMTDGAGHGVLVATDNIFAQISSSTGGATNVCRVKILYRWKNVAIEEFVGIVQSQQ